MFEYFGEIKRITIMTRKNYEYLTLENEEKSEIIIFPDYKEGIIRLKVSNYQTKKDIRDTFQLKEGIKIENIFVSMFEVRILLKSEEVEYTLVCKYTLPEENELLSTKKCSVFNVRSILKSVINSNIYSKILKRSHYLR